MKRILVATKETQGQRKNDFSHVPEGEPVHFTFECDGETVDGSCGCKRSMSGLVSGTATTTFKVAESDVDIEELIYKFLHESWKLEESEARKEAKNEAHEIHRLAEFFPVGMILEKRGKNIRERRKVKVTPERKAS